MEGDDVRITLEREAMKISIFPPFFLLRVVQLAQHATPWGCLCTWTLMKRYWNTPHVSIGRQKCPPIVGKGEKKKSRCIQVTGVQRARCITYNMHYNDIVYIKAEIPLMLPHPPLPHAPHSQIYTGVSVTTFSCH